MRQFIMSHPDYKHDSVVSESINYDLMKRIDDLAKGGREQWRGEAIAAHGAWLSETARGSHRSHPWLPFSFLLRAWLGSPGNVEEPTLLGRNRTRPAEAAAASS